MGNIDLVLKSLKSSYNAEVVLGTLLVANLLQSNIEKIIYLKFL